MRMTITIDVPDLVGEVLKAGLADSEQVLICPQTMSPGFIGTIVKDDDDV
jgi:hypothetical protein